MAIIGSFTKQEDGSFRGTISTPLVNGRAVITSIEKMGDKAPDYRVYLGKYELGAAWSTTSKDGKSTHLSVKLTPHFPNRGFLARNFRFFRCERTPSGD